MSDEIAIKVENVSKNFVLPHEKVSTIKSLFTSATKKRNKGTETQHALKDISFEVKKGEFFGIVGRNGSGKSTLLKILANIYQPTTGTIETKGKLVPFIELGVGFNPELTGRENVFLNGAMLGFAENEIEAMYDDIVEFAELERFMDQKLKNYSSGMQVRLAFSMATRSQADILLVDEVLAVGDADFQRKCFEYFRELKKNKKTVVFVSHDMNAVRQYCDKAILIDKNKVVKSGDANAIAVEYARMFMEGDSEKALSKAGKRWGSKSTYFVNVTTEPSQLSDKNTPIVISANIKCQTNAKNLIVGFSIKNSSGTHILGTNSRLQSIKTGNWQAATVKHVEWSIQNLFTDGNYAVDVAILEEDEVTVCDWWEDATVFTSFESNPPPYVTSPNIKTLISE